MEQQAKRTQVWNVRFDTEANRYIPFRERNPFIYYWETEAAAANEAERLNIDEGLLKQSPVVVDESPLDFSSSGLGIGGINNDQTMPFVPSVAAIKRVQRMRDNDVVCLRCGASQNFDGAMFTTGGGDVCDDCF